MDLHLKLHDGQIGAIIVTSRGVRVCKRVRAFSVGGRSLLVNGCNLALREDHDAISGDAP